MKKFFLPITRDYIEHWSIAEAVRELMQNAIDAETEDPLNKATMMFKKNNLVIKNPYSKLELKTLLLGGGTKKNNSRAIGKFGEGYKLAVVVLLRLGCDFTVKNGADDWIFAFEHNEDFDAEILSVTIYEKKRKKDGGLVFSINGLSDEDVDSIKLASLYFGKYQELKNESGGVIVGSQQAFVGGLATSTAQYLTGNGMLFYSLNYHPHDIELDRDRRGIANLYSSFNTRKIAQIICASPFFILSSLFLGASFNSMNVYGVEDYVPLEKWWMLREKLVLDYITEHWDDYLGLVDEDDPWLRDLTIGVYEASDDVYNKFIIVRDGDTRLPQFEDDNPFVIPAKISERIARAIDHNLQEDFVRDQSDVYMEKDIEKILKASSLSDDIIAWIQKNYQDLEEDSLYELVDLFDIKDETKKSIKSTIQSLKELS